MKWFDGTNRKSSACVRFACSACFAFVVAFGCRSTVPIHVWQPATITCPHDAKVAVAPLAGPELVASRVETALIAEHPTVRSDIQLIASQYLVNQSPMRLVSSGGLQNDSAAIQAARQASADFLLEGEILSAKFIDPKDRKPPKHKEPPENELLLISWRLVEVSTSRSLANQVVSIDTRRADRDYPEMVLTHPDPTDRLIAASARDSWKSLAPSVERDKVDLMVPWLQVGAMTTRSGIVDAHKGRWDLAEQKFALAARRNPLNVSAHHNLAIAQAAREDFPAAKQQLSEVSWPLSLRLPAESRFWLDQRQRQFQAAHGLGKPAEGWLFPDPPTAGANETEVLPVTPLQVEDLPWWTAIPLTKPPGWTWRAWLRQPWIL